MAHYRFNIRHCHHTEMICFSMKKMHIEGKDSLAPEGRENIKKLALDNYQEYNWEKGGYGNYGRFDFVRKK